MRGTWSYVKCTHGMKPVPFTWVFKQKPLEAEGTKFIEKARSFLRGDRQMIYVDYDPRSVYAPVASLDSIRMLISLSAAARSFLEGADVSNAYLYGNLDIPIIMEQPRDSSKIQAKPGRVCKLHKSLYRTKQAGEIWGSLLDKQLKEWGFKNSEYDNRIYFYVTGSKFIMFAIVVYDLAFSSNSPSLLRGFKSKLDATFDVRIFGKLTNFIGWNISRTQSGIRIDQPGYVKQILKDFGMKKANGLNISLPSTADGLPAHENEQVLSTVKHKPYRSLIGSLMYLAISTRPDIISFAVGVFAR